LACTRVDTIQIEGVLKQQDEELFWHKTERIINVRRRLHKYELDNLSFLVQIIKNMKERRMGLLEQVARMGKG
jgi:predicted metal-dependent hydrolase